MMNSLDKMQLLQLIESCRDELIRVASYQLNQTLRSKVDPDDIVQTTITKAWSRLDELRDHSPETIKAWLRAILTHTIADLHKGYLAGKRNVRREREIESDSSQSGAGLGAGLAADHTSPSMKAVRNENWTRLIQAIDQLPAEMREILLLKHVQLLTLKEVAEKSGRSEASVASLLRRGMARLREMLS